MSWSIGFDTRWKRDIGYGVPATCDHPGCGAKIDRGLAYVCCGSARYGGSGCGLYFCECHRHGEDGKCERCMAEDIPFNPTSDTTEWINHKLTDETWEQWRNENPALVADYRMLSMLLFAKERMSKCLGLIQKGLRNGSIKSKPILTGMYDPDATEIEMKSLDEVISEAIL